MELPMRLSLLVCVMLGACAPVAPPMSANPVAVVDQLAEDVRILSADDMHGRLAGSSDDLSARAYITGRLKALGVAPVLPGGFEEAFTLHRGKEDMPAANLIGIIPGTGGSDRAVVVMAHFDHVGMNNGQIYNGADDNASGVAGVLAIAESLKKKAPLHDVIIALVDGEEEGEQGSKAMVADPAMKSVMDRVVIAVNLDMVSRSDRNELYAAGAYHFPWLKPRIAALAATAPVILKQGHDRPELKDDDWTDQSDHFAFQQVHKPWVYFGVENHPDYHQPTDDFTAIPLDFFHHAVETVEMGVRAFDKDLEAIASEANGQGG
jgi:hypothetical protein